MRVRIHSKNVDPKCKWALIAMIKYALSELFGPSHLRLANNLSIDLHLRHHAVDGETKIHEEKNKNFYRPRAFKVIIDHHRIRTNNIIGKRRTNKEWFVEILRTLAHELVHVKQYALGELSFRDRKGIILFKGATLRNAETLSEYFNLPYEIEAYGRENGLLLGFISIWKEKANIPLLNRIEK